MERLFKKRIIITGASSGIGKKLAVILAECGAKLVLVARNKQKLEEVRLDVLKRHNPSFFPLIYTCDISDRYQVKNMVNTIVDLIGGVDILINNAGIGVYGEFEAHDVSDFQQVMNVNFFGALNCILEVLPWMRRSGKGQIINVASIAAIHGIPYLSAYCASKAALVSTCQSLRAELSNTNIEIKIIYPGYTDTAFFMNEKKVGKASRPKTHFQSPENVAHQILKIIEKSRSEKVLSIDGLKLLFLQKYMPGLLEKLLSRYAISLRQ